MPQTGHPSCCSSQLTNNAPPARLELKITSDPANLRAVRVEIEQFASSAGLPPKSVDSVGLVLNEALANVIRHGYDQRPDQPIVITAEVRDRELSLSIRDWSEPFDPSKLPQPADVSPTPDKVKPGGLGLLCIRKLMDSAKFTPLEDGMLLTMTKKLPAKK